MAFAPGSVDAMMLLALALHLDPVYVGAHHVTRIVLVSVAMSVIARRAAGKKAPIDGHRPAERHNLIICRSIRHPACESRTWPAPLRGRADRNANSVRANLED